MAEIDKLFSDTLVKGEGLIKDEHKSHLIRLLNQRKRRMIVISTLGKTTFLLIGICIALSCLHTSYNTIDVREELAMTSDEITVDHGASDIRSRSKRIRPTQVYYPNESLIKKEVSAIEQVASDPVLADSILHRIGPITMDISMTSRKAIKFINASALTPPDMLDFLKPAKIASNSTSNYTVFLTPYFCSGVHLGLNNDASDFKNISTTNFGIDFTIARKSLSFTSGFSTLDFRSSLSVLFLDRMTITSQPFYHKIESDNRFTYTTVPFLLGYKYRIGNRISMYARTGIRLGFLRSSSGHYIRMENEKTSEYSLSAGGMTSKRIYQKEFDVSLGYTLLPGIKVIAGASYRSLTNSLINSINHSPNTLGYFIGMQFNLN